MCRAARNDENSEAHENPVELQVFAPAHEIQQREWNREVSEGDQRVGQDVQRQDVRTPEVAHAVGHEAIGGEQVLEVAGHYGTSSGCTPLGREYLNAFWPKLYSVR